MAFKHEAKDDREYLRQVVFDDYCLRIWDTGRRDPPNALGYRVYLGYELVAPDGTCLFLAEDFSPPPNLCIDSSKVLRELLGFLTLKPGDTDEEYFEKYTPEQLAFAESDAEMLSLWADEENDRPRLNFAGGPDGGGSCQFNNLDDWVNDDD